MKLSFVIVFVQLQLPADYFRLKLVKKNLKIFGILEKIFDENI